ncbi:Uncharacterised protein [uncultured Clostridium sp.]|uniref:lactate dehydrogenase n=1 Tax=uncultured Clostridium sp. TaxID=59620 RepID=UPI0008230844|nr:lactate dehydrogenase [uncultured Clostridium sp.]SCJ97447.1 Uncharacterised protein [uncultured Clostridium sp.]
MFGIPAIEWVGYVASICIAISLLMTDMFKLRIINSIGCILFVIYGFSIKAYPVGGINLFIFFVNIYYIIKMRKDK